MVTVYFNREHHEKLVLSVFRFTVSDYTFDISKLFLSFFFWSLYCLFFFDLWLLLTLLIFPNFSCPFSFGHYIVCSSLIYDFCLHLWYFQTFLVLFLLVIILSVLLRFTASDYTLDISKLFLSFLAHLGKGNVSFCPHLASVVRRLSSVIFSHFNLLLWNPSAKWTETW